MVSVCSSHGRSGFSPHENNLECQVLVSPRREVAAVFYQRGATLAWPCQSSVLRTLLQRTLRFRKYKIRKVDILKKSLVCTAKELHVIGH